MLESPAVVPVHDEEGHRAETGADVHVVILGGGYAGVAAAHRLAQIADRSWSLTLIDRKPAQTLQPRLADVVAGQLTAKQACVPYDRLLPRRVHLVSSEILSFDPARQAVRLTDRILRADRTIVALGTTPSDLGVPGAGDFSRRITTAADAAALNAAVRRLGARARVGIIGAGYTATEVAAALLEVRRDLHVLVVSDAPTLLGSGKERLGRLAERMVRRQGVTLRLGEGVRRVDARALVLLGGDRECADLVIWAAPSQPTEPVRDAFGLPPGARILVDSYLRVQGAAGVYAAGDATAVVDLRSGRPAAANAQVAIYSGTLAADNLVATETGGQLRESRPRPSSEVISLGRHNALAEVFGVTLRGRAALALKEAALARYLYRYGGTRLAAAYAVVP